MTSRCLQRSCTALCASLSGVTGFARSPTRRLTAVALAVSQSLYPNPVQSPGGRSKDQWEVSATVVSPKDSVDDNQIDARLLSCDNGSPTRLHSGGRASGPSIIDSETVHTNSSCAPTERHSLLHRPERHVRPPSRWLCEVMAQ